MSSDLDIFGDPDDLESYELSIFSSRISKAWNELNENYKGKYDLGSLEVYMGNAIDELKKSYQTSAKQENTENNDDEENQQVKLDAKTPYYKFEQLILPKDIVDKMMHRVRLLELQDLVFNEWNLKQIEPYPRSALNFYGPPGTGKTMAAHAIASYLNKKIILASYAEIESKFHGDGPKNVKAVFKQAEETDALLFIDEADSLLSKRLSNVTQGSEQAINSMRSQLLICLEQFSGIVIFSTNFVENYDKAFETRVTNIEFRLPEAPEREKIWLMHLPKELPTSFNRESDIKTLAEEVDDICGRDIKNAVIDSALKAACDNTIVSMNLLKESIQTIKDSRIKEKEADNEEKGEPISDEEKQRIEKRLQFAFDMEDSEFEKASANANLNIDKNDNDDNIK